MKYILIQDCKSCPNKHLDIRYFSCHRDRTSGWWCNKENRIITSIDEIFFNTIISFENFLEDNKIPDWCPLGDYKDE